MITAWLSSPEGQQQVVVYNIATYISPPFLQPRHRTRDDTPPMRSHPMPLGAHPVLRWWENGPTIAMALEWLFAVSPSGGPDGAGWQGRVINMFGCAEDSLGYIRWPFQSRETSRDLLGLRSAWLAPNRPCPIPISSDGKRSVISSTHRSLIVTSMCNIHISYTQSKK